MPVGGQPDRVADAGALDERQQVGDLQFAAPWRASVALRNGCPNAAALPIVVSICRRLRTRFIMATRLVRGMNPTMKCPADNLQADRRQFDDLS
jgi:hypothetical protein